MRVTTVRIRNFRGIRELDLRRTERLFSRYCQMLVTANRLDFGSLLYFARRLLAEKSGVARVVRLGWTHVGVDEFQDTNRAQYDLLRLIAPGRRARLFIVGDEDQIIYQWNGANPERLAQLRRDYDLHVVQLPECYRCPASIIVLANRLIVHNARRFPNKSPLQASRADGHGDANDVRYETFASPDEEAAFIPKDISNRGLNGSECVVLGRTAKLLGRAASALVDAGIEACMTPRKTDFESPAIALMQQSNLPEVLALLRAVPRDLAAPVGRRGGIREISIRPE